MIKDRMNFNAKSPETSQIHYCNVVNHLNGRVNVIQHQHKLLLKIDAMTKYFISFTLILFVLVLYPFKLFAQDTERPNIILIMADDLNQFVGAYGEYDQVHTPNIDRLASKGTLFTNAHSNAQVCAPSRASLFTGIYPHHSENFGFENWRNNSVLRNSNTIMEQLRDYGYKTAGVGKLMHQPWRQAWDEYGLKQDYTPIAFNGTEKVGHPSVPLPFRNIGPLDATFARLSDIPIVPSDSINPGHEGWYLFPLQQTFEYNSATDRDLLPDEKTIDWAIDKLKQWELSHDQAPFFLGIGLIRPHTPLVVPDKFFDMFPKEDIKLPLILENDAEDTYFEKQFFPDESKGKYHYNSLISSFSTKEDALKTYYQAYLASIAFMDEQVGRFLDTLEASDFAQNSIVIFTSDHGYTLGEKEQLFKNNLWESSTRVPLVIYDPAIEQVSKVSTPVSLIDLFPTISDMGKALYDNRKNSNGHVLGGKSLTPLLHGNQNEFQNYHALSVVTYKGDKHYSLRTEKWRYIEYSDGSEELYDHTKDPYETTNLAASIDHTSIKEYLRNDLQEILKQSSD